MATLTDNRPDQNTNADSDPNNPAKKLSVAEQAAADQQEALDADIQKLENQANDPKAHKTYVDNWSSRRSKKSEKLSIRAMKLLKKAGPTGAIGGGVVAVAIALMSSVSLTSLLPNLKENAVLNHSQMSSSEIRTLKILAKRLGEQTTSRCSALSTLLCRYEKPSNRLLTRMETEKIKAFDKNGNLISKQKILNGTRPAAYSFNDGDLIEAKDFEKTMRNNGDFSRAFRRAYSPRWALFADDVAVKLLRSLGISKTVPDSIKNADTADPPEKKLASTLPDTDSDKATREVAELAETGVEKEAKNLAKQAASKLSGDTALNTAVMACIASSVPGVYANVSRQFKLALIAATAFAPLIVADTQKAGAADGNMVSNMASVLTDTYTKSDGTKVASAMSAGLMYYLLTGSAQDGASDKNRTMFALGLQNPILGSYINLTSSSTGLKSFCNAVSSNEAQLTSSTIQLALKTTPVGWVLFGLDAITIVLDWTGALDALMEAAGDIAIEVVKKINLPWEDIAKAILGSIDTGVAGAPLGSLVSIGITNIFASLANASGGLPMTPEQYVEYNNTVVKPTQLAWIKEDQANYSPFDTSNPHTAFGSIASALLPYTGSFSSISGALSSITSLSALSFGSTLFANNAYASTDLQGKNWCQDDTVIQAADIVVGPACDIQYGIPAEYLGTDPTVVVEALTNSGDIDENGEVVKDSELDEFISRCNTGSVLGLESCTIDSSATASLASYTADDTGIGEVTLANTTSFDTNTKRAFFALYQMDKRILESMDNPPADTSTATNTSSSNTSTTTPTTSTPSSDGWVVPLDNSATRGTFTVSLDWHVWASKGLHKGVDIPSPYGTPVYAAHDGTVTRIIDMGSCGWATVIQVTGTSSLYMGYQHMNPSVSVGQNIKQGQQIGVVGKFCGSGFHLHFSIETANRVSAYADKGSKDTSLDPFDYIPDLRTPSGAS